MEILKIGEMAKYNNISIQTLRYYDEIDLLKPVYICPDTNYRFYSLAQSSDLDTIIFLKNLDFSLSQIKDILNEPNQTEAIRKVVLEKTQEIEEEKKEINRKLKKIKKFNNSFSYFEQYRNMEGIKIEKLPKRYIKTFKTNMNIYDMDLYEYEKNLRLFKQNLDPNEHKFFNNVGSIMTKDSFLNAEFHSDEMFIIKDSKNRSNYDKVIPDSYYAITFCHLFENELTAIKQFRENLLRNGYIITGDYICEVIHELPYKKEGQRNMFIRLQIPVEVYNPYK